MSESISVEHLNLSYGKVKAVQNLSFAVQEGEIAAIIGPNGSGKTSTVECLEGLRRPDGGRLKVFGLDPLKNKAEVYARLGVQLQESDYPPKIKVGELCEQFASFYARPADWQLLLKELNLADKKKRLVEKLSGGERQKLSIVLALMGRPKMIIMDELTTGLDPEVRQSIRAWFAQMKKQGIGMIMVSHYLDEVEQLADKILFLEKGQQMFFGTQAEFRAYAKSRILREKINGKETLEKLYLQLSPEANAISMEGIL